MLFKSLKKEEKMNAFGILSKRKTLLVDDDPFIRDAMKLAFDQKGFSLQTARTAEEGLKAMHGAGFDIIISDFKLPGINGLTFLKQAVISQPEAVKVLISANGDDEMISQAYTIGVHDFLQKPFTQATLWATLIMHLEKKGDQYDRIFEGAILLAKMTTGPDEAQLKRKGIK